MDKELQKSIEQLKRLAEQCYKAMVTKEGVQAGYMIAKISEAVTSRRVG